MPRKSRELWILAGVTYAAVIALTVAAAVVYFYWSPRVKTETTEPSLVAVGSFWIPAYPGASATGETSSVNQQGIIQTTLRVKSTDPAEKVFSFYVTKLRSGNFRESSFSKAGSGGTILANRLDGRGQVLVTISSLPVGSEGSITALERPRIKQ